MTKKILIVEDNPELHEMFRMKFEKWWFEVHIAEDGFAGLWKAVDENPDIILLDIMMPNMDGFETLQTIKNQTSLDTKIIIFSNVKNNAHVEKAKKLWADDYLVKSDNTPAQVYDKVMEVLGLWTLEKQNITCPHCWWKIDIDK